MLVDTATTANLPIVLKLDSTLRRGFHDVQNSDGFLHDFGPDMIAWEDEDAECLWSGGIGEDWSCHGGGENEMLLI